MAVLRVTALRDYLKFLHKRNVHIVRVDELGRARKQRPIVRLKGFGFGTPYLVEYEVGGKMRTGVFETLRPGAFGHDFSSDMAHSLLLAHSTYNRLPRHARSIDVGILTRKGDLRSVGDFEEFFLFVEKVEGKGYYEDLARIRDSRVMTKMDMKRCLTLSNYIARIHAVKKNAPQLYVRRIRDLVGHGECIMGLIDGYPMKAEFLEQNELQQIEKTCIEWRWKLKNKCHRLSRVHGDFHPFNVIFRGGTDFTVLDRSRGEWGEPADDVAAMSINYILFSVQAHGDLSGPLAELYEAFMRSYLDETKDEELLEVIQPFYAWRSLVVANPTWYPTLPTDARRKLLNFARSTLESQKFDLSAVNRYIR